jgi:hypothetical protein
MSETLKFIEEQTSLQIKKSSMPQKDTGKQSGYYANRKANKSLTSSGEIATIKQLNKLTNVSV